MGYGLLNKKTLLKAFVSTGPLSGSRCRIPLAEESINLGSCCTGAAGNVDEPQMKRGKNTKE